MKRSMTLGLLLALATWLAPNNALATEGLAAEVGLQDGVTLHGIEREGDIPLP